MDAGSGLVLAVDRPSSVYSVADPADGRIVIEPADLPDAALHVIPMFSRDAGLVAAIDENGVTIYVESRSLRFGGLSGNRHRASPSCG